MSDPLRIALAGLGTVGTGVIELLETNRSTIERRAGRALQIVAVNARDRTRDRGVDLSPSPGSTTCRRWPPGRTG